MAQSMLIGERKNFPGKHQNMKWMGMIQSDQNWQNFAIWAISQWLEDSFRRSNFVQMISNFFYFCFLAENVSYLLWSKLRLN